MDPVVTVVVTLIVVGVVAGWLLLRSRRTPPVEDEWTLPPPDEPPAAEPVNQVLSREVLLNPDRRLDPSRWDNSPDSAPQEQVEGDLPTHFDREYLRRRAEQ